jgi:hypothetical protein
MGCSVEDADRLLGIFSGWLGISLMHKLVAIQAELDKDLIEGLERVGFKTNFGLGGTGYFGQIVRYAGKYTINSGTSDLIVEGKIGIKNGRVKRFLDTGIEFEDGSSLENLDVIVLALGNGNLRRFPEELYGKDIMDKVSDFWGIDHQGQFRAYRSTGHPGFWIQCGGIPDGRVFSKKLVLQILAEEAGVKSKAR